MDHVTLHGCWTHVSEVSSSMQMSCHRTYKKSSFVYIYVLHLMTVSGASQLQATM